MIWLEQLAMQTPLAFTGFSALRYAWLGLLLIPLLILYFLKLKRPRMEISSLTLWQQVINDQRVNSPFQKFKRNLLLWLQLALLLALVLAAMQPFFRGSADQAQNIPVLIDCSASMAATDDAGKTRLEIVKQRVNKLVDDLMPDQRLSLISVGSAATRLTSFTDNKTMLRDALAKLEVADVQSELDHALRLAQALTKGNKVDKAIIFSDGNLPETYDFELPFEVNYQRVPAAGANIGITSLNARRSKSDRWNLFVRVQASDHVVAANVEVLQNDEVLVKDYVKLEAGASQRLVFPLSSTGAANVQVRLLPDGPDSLVSDNLAGLLLPKGRSLAVYCDPKMESFRKALNVIGQIDVYPEEGEEAGGTLARSTFDLLITDKAVSEGIDARVHLNVGLVPADLAKTVTINTGAAEVVDWQRNARLLQHVQLNSVIFSDEPSSFPDIGDTDYESLGYEILAHARNAPLILKKRSNDQLKFHLLFQPKRSTLPYRVGFPILVANAVSIALQEAELSDVPGVRTGVFPPLDVASAKQSYQVTSPDGQTSGVTSNEEAVVSGIAADVVGKYAISAGDERKEVWASLLSPRETSLASVNELQFRELKIDAAESEVRTDRPLWPYLAMIGFALLLTEWWYSNRRPVVA